MKPESRHLLSAASLSTSSPAAGQTGRVVSRSRRRRGAAAAAAVGTAALACWMALPPTLRAEAGWREQVEADWLRQEARRGIGAVSSQQVTPAEDAAGAVDGVKEGKWGFHTAHQANPWWQVDLGRTRSLERLVIYNRCDGFAERNSRIQVLLSKDGKDFREAYQHDGTVFYGARGGQPLAVTLPGTEARFVRLAVSGSQYFHLDEVEVFAAGENRNIALGKPATQSSVSEWSARHHPQARQTHREYSIAQALARGRKLAESQSRLGVNVDSALARFREIEEEAGRVSADASDEARRALYFRARWAVRELALGNPLLNFDQLLFVKRAPGMFPHMSDQYYGWWSRPGGGIFVLRDFKGPNPRLRSLTEGMPTGSFMGPDVSFDGKKLLFAWCKYHPELANEQNKANKARVAEDAFYHVYEMNVDGSGRRQITHGKYDDFDPRYLPNGDIVFLSTRKGTAIQCGQWFSDATRSTDLPDSYVRCGGDNYRPVPVFTMHGMSPDGANIRPLSAFENFEWTPSVADDGRILYTRWDYIDRFNGHFFSLWSANQDGTNPQLVYGNYTVKPQVKFEARSVPGSSQIVFTAGAHHSNIGGTLCLLDRARGTEGEAPLTRLTPDVRYPETEANDDQYYANPWPLSEEYYLVAWADSKLPPHRRCEDAENPVNATGIYLFDAFGNLELLHRDPAISSASPMPVMARARPPAHAPLAHLSSNPGESREGQVLVQDIYRGLAGVPAGSIKQLRIVAVLPKVQPHMNNPVLGVSAEDPGKFVLGTVPVEQDGSAYFRIPSGVPVFFQALDPAGAAVQTMRTLTYSMGAQVLSCVGCHEHRESAPAVGGRLLAAARAPSQVTPGPEGSWPLRFDKLVQPVLDRHCVECHRPGGKGFEKSKLDFAGRNAYQDLLRFGDEDLKKKAFERDRSLPGDAVAANTRLWKMLTASPGHHKVALDPDSLNRLATWLDTYAHQQGHFSDQQERELLAFREQIGALLARDAAK